MTIKDTIALYREKGRDSVSPTLRALVDQMIATGARTEFKNDSYADALYLTDTMFDQSQVSIRILTGAGGGEFLHALEKSFTEALERLKAIGSEARVIILDTDKIDDWLVSMQEKFNNFKIARGRTISPVKHVIVCDSRMARLEEIHPPLVPETPVESIKATVFFNEPSKAKVYEDYFDSVWNNVAKK
jgi:hypothetical protein